MIPTLFGLLLASCLAVTVVQGYGNGLQIFSERSSVCDSLSPDSTSHGIQGSAASNPFTLQVSRTGNNFHLKVVGEEFEGLMIQAQKNGDTSATSFGSFTSFPTSLMRSVTSCSRPTLIHANDDDKDQAMTLTWTPTSTCNSEQVKFVVVAMKERYEWWRFESVTDIDWNDWSACSVTCGGGSQTRTSVCGASDQTQACNTQACSGFTLGTWSAWSACTAECDQTRTRTCTETVTDACLNQPAQDTRACTGGTCPNAGSAESEESNSDSNSDSTSEEGN